MDWGIGPSITAGANCKYRIEKAAKTDLLPHLMIENDSSFQLDFPEGINLLSHQSIGEKKMQAKWVCLPKMAAGMDITSQPGSALMDATSRVTAKKDNAPVAAGPPYPQKKTVSRGANARMAPTTLLIPGANRDIAKSKIT